MSTSETDADRNDFERWIATAFEEEGSFTALIVLVAIGETSVTPLCSTSVKVIGPDADWSDLTVMFAGSGQDWHGAAFFPRQDAHGRPLDNPTTRLRLRELEAALDGDRLVLNEGHFFDRWGRRMKVEELTRQ